jgi:hypothetical protein
MKSPFNITSDTMVVTSSYIVYENKPVLEVSHEDDEEGGSLWQFHCGNGDYSMEKMKLVMLHTILSHHPDLLSIPPLKKGETAKRSAPGEPWNITGVIRD